MCTLDLDISNFIIKDGMIIYSAEILKILKEIIHHTIIENYETLRDKTLYDLYNDLEYKKLFDEQFDKYSQHNMFVESYWADIMTHTDDRLHNELVSFFKHHYGYDKEFVTTAYRDPHTGYFKYFGIHPNFANIYGVYDTRQIKKVRCVISENQERDWDAADYWGWWKYATGAYDMIYINFKVFHVCFPYGVDAEEKAYVGKAYKLDVVECEDV